MGSDVEEGELNRPMLDVFLAESNLARLATADPKTGKPHVVPVWYYWDGATIWIHSYSKTRKVRNLQANPQCSILIDAAESGVDFRAALFEGDVVLINEPFEFVRQIGETIYKRYLGEEGVQREDPQSWLNDPDMLLIKLKPQKTRTWYSAARA
jgi:PPOX class probable F420-dependent enzyme